MPPLNFAKEAGAQKEQFDMDDREPAPKAQGHGYDPIAKAKANPKSRKLALIAKCWECVGAGHDPNPRRTIRECSVFRCPLHAIRPYQAADTDEVAS